MSERTADPSHKEGTLPPLDLDSYTDTRYLTHSFHPYPAKFIPQIPRQLILHLTDEGDVVLDPFCGSGTTLVEATLLGRAAVGVDCNPIAVIIAKAKTLCLNPSQRAIVRRFRDQVKDATLSRKFLGDLPTEVRLPEFTNRDKWFKLPALEELLFLNGLIQDNEDGDVRSFLQCCLSSIVVKSSNQESETRWKAINRPIERGATLGHFLKALDLMLEKSRAFASALPLPPRVDVYHSDARKLEFLDADSIDFVVTSPPYMNSFDYYLYHKLRLFVLGFDHKEVQEVEIGSRYMHHDRGYDKHVFKSEMTICLKEISRVLRPSGRLCMVVGDAIQDGALIPMDSLYEDMMVDLQFDVLDRFSFPQRKYSRYFLKGWKRGSKRSHIFLAAKA